MSTPALAIVKFNKPVFCKGQYARANRKFVPHIDWDRSYPADIDREGHGNGDLRVQITDAVVVPVYLDEVKSPMNLKQWIRKQHAKVALLAARKEFKRAEAWLHECEQDWKDLCP